MIVLLTAWLALGLVSAVTGGAVLSLVGWPEQLKHREERFFVSVWVGLFTCASIVLGVASIVPLRSWYLASALLLLAARSVRVTLHQLMLTWSEFLVIGLIATGMSRLASGSGTLYDSSLYHSQLVRWMSDYGLPPGLGLLHYRFGFSSSWLALTALFDQGPLSYRMLNSVTGFAIVLLLAQFAFALTRKGERKDRGPDLYLITAIPTLLLFAGGLVLVQSASPNFGVGAAFVLTGWLLVTGASALSLLLGGGALAVKINAAIILPFVCTRARRTIWIGTILLALPLALANSRTTGCLAYPAPLFCSNTPSSISPAETRQVSYEAVDQGRRGDSLTAWAGRWAVGLNRYALVLFALSLAVLIATRSWNRAASLAVGSYIFYFVVSPDIRFTFGPTALLAGCAGMAALPGIRIPRVPKEVWASLIAGGIVAADHGWESWRQQNGLVDQTPVKADCGFPHAPISLQASRELSFRMESRIECPLAVISVDHGIYHARRRS